MTMATMRRRELLKTACFAAGVVLPGESAARAATQSETTPDSSLVSDPSPDSTARWFLDWLPPHLQGATLDTRSGQLPPGEKEISPMTIPHT
jgi:hypothetical protein